MDIKDYEVKGTTNCECGHCFNMLDYTELKRINEYGFYSNQVKHYSPTQCPACKKETLLLLKQVGQTYAVVDIATKKQNQNDENAKNNVLEPTIKDEEPKEINNEFICPECKKVCKNKLGLNAHMKTHQN